MEVKARLRYLRMSPRKVRLVIDMVRGLKVEQAVHQLEFSQKAASKPVLKLLKSAIANAEHNHRLETSTLKIVSITADGGPTLYRWMPRAHGRATPIRKRTTHVNLVLSDGKAGSKLLKHAPKEAKASKTGGTTKKASEAKAPAAKGAAAASKQKSASGNAKSSSAKAKNA